MKYTYLGDGGMNGWVNQDDYSIFLTYLGQQTGRWIHGDWSSDGRVDGDDYSIWLTGVTFCGGSPAQVLRPSGEGGDDETRAQAFAAFADPIGWHDWIIKNFGDELAMTEEYLQMLEESMEESEGL